jgi:hypothetical protein
MMMKEQEKTMSRTSHVAVKSARYRPDEALMAFLTSL